MHENDNKRDVKMTNVCSAIRRNKKAGEILFLRTLTLFSSFRLLMAWGNKDCSKLFPAGILTTAVISKLEKFAILSLY